MISQPPTRLPLNLNHRNMWKCGGLFCVISSRRSPLGLDTILHNRTKSPRIEGKLLGLEQELSDFPYLGNWETHDPNWRSYIFQRVGQPPTRKCSLIQSPKNFLRKQHGFSLNPSIFHREKMGKEPRFKFTLRLIHKRRGLEATAPEDEAVTNRMWGHMMST
jgi:hypothetical protein